MNSIRLVDRMADDSFHFTFLEIHALTLSSCTFMWGRMYSPVFTRTFFSSGPTFNLCGWNTNTWRCRAIISIYKVGPNWHSYSFTGLVIIEKSSWRKHYDIRAIGEGRGSCKENRAMHTLYKTILKQLPLPNDVILLGDLAKLLGRAGQLEC